MPYSVTEAQKASIMVDISGQYLSDYLPDDWQDMEDEDLWYWMEENNWEPFQHYSGEEVFKLIEQTADSIISWIRVNL
jgi:hypothetical protein